MNLINALKTLIIEQLVSNGKLIFNGVNENTLIQVLDKINNFKIISIVGEDGNAKKPDNGSELLEAIKNNKITGQEMGKVINSLLRNEDIDENIVNAANKEFIKSSSFKRKYKDKATMKEGLLLSGFSKKAISSIYKNLNLPEPGVTIPSSGTLTEKIFSSINQRNIAVLSYDGEDPGGKGNREVEPVALGYSKAGNDVLRAWDFWGASHSAAKGEQPKPGWRLFRLDKIISFTPTNETFNVKKSNYNENGDESMTEVLVNAKF